MLFVVLWLGCLSFVGRILWMNVSRLLLPQLVSMYFGGIRAGRIGSMFFVSCLFFDRSVK